MPSKKPQLQIRATRREIDAYSDAAAQAGLTRSAWIRTILGRAAGLAIRPTPPTQDTVLIDD